MIDEFTLSSNSFLRVAADRWNHCKAATAATTDHTNFILVGPVTGINSDPLVISLQNTFCSMQNVALYYPFLEEDFQKALWNTDNPRRYELRNNNS